VDVETEKSCFVGIPIHTGD